jgi:hypothetical protein
MISLQTHINFKYNILSKLQINSFAGITKSNPGKTDF